MSSKVPLPLKMTAR